MRSACSDVHSSGLDKWLTLPAKLRPHSSRPTCDQSLQHSRQSPAAPAHLTRQRDSCPTCCALIVLFRILPQRTYFARSSARKQAWLCSLRFRQLGRLQQSETGCRIVDIDCDCLYRLTRSALSLAITSALPQFTGDNMSKCFQHASHAVATELWALLRNGCYSIMAATHRNSSLALITSFSRPTRSTARTVRRLVHAGLGL